MSCLDSLDIIFFVAMDIPAERLLERYKSFLYF